MFIGDINAICSNKTIVSFLAACLDNSNLTHLSDSIIVQDDTECITILRLNKSRIIRRGHRRVSEVSFQVV